MKKKLSSAIARRKNKANLIKLRKNILSFYDSQPNVTAEQLEIVQFLKVNPLKVFPYQFTENYDKQKVQIYYDEDQDLKYVIHEKKRLYFKRRMSENGIKSLYNGLLIDQDDASPHKYLNSIFSVNKNDVVVDAGAAEGNFSLSVIDKVDKIYLFESDPEWIEPLKATFEPWKNKVEIIQKLVSNESKETSIALDDFYLNNPFTFVKADIEGDENKLLEGLQKTLQSPFHLKIAVCTYHKQDDFQVFSELLRNHQYKINTPNGYMIFYYDKNIKAPFLRRGLIRAWKDA
ncbi:FkbM family methyltransferase [Salegentibacter sp. BDJ18]|uniref:FkbM family methyltransferase n=1 Tax=Salegentibacter sp. BDJ18 TaxID=2816376 RepID=UPI001AAE4845|nr:FkbM family methyltransferase [Salegentibacter sp. BDJ18]